MIPAHFVVLDALPLLANGKLDRKALPTPDHELQHRAQIFVGPRTEIEELVAQVWRETLKRDRIGIHANFFELGGHSLLVTQIVARLAAVYDGMIPFRALFDHPTVASLAHYLQTSDLLVCLQRLAPIVRVEHRCEFPLSFSQQHLWALDKLIPQTPFFNMPYAYRLLGPLDIVALKKTLHRIMLRHHALRTRFAEIDGVPYQIVAPRPCLDLNIFDLRSTATEMLDHQVQHLMSKEASLPFDLAKGPPFRAYLYRLGDEHNVLLVVMHHIISDRWSLNVFFEELVTYYRAFCERRPAVLPDPPVQSVDFALWEKRVLESGLLSSQIEYWKETLCGLPQNNLTYDNHQPNKLSLHTARKTIVLGEKLFNDLKRFAREEHCTVFMVLYASFAILLYQHTKQSDIRIGTIVANRSQRQMESVIGHFVNTIILRIQISLPINFRNFLRRVRTTVFQAFSNQELPFEKLLQILEEDSAIDRTRLFPALINYHAYNSETQRVCGLSFASLGWQPPSYLEELMFTTFDLVASFHETSTTLTASVTVKTESFRQCGIEGVIQRFEHILTTMIDNSESPVLECLNELERM
jgi:hypothetical protein